MDFNDITQFIQGVGFPIFAACFFMIKGTKDNEKTNEVLNGVREALTKLQMSIEQHDKKED